MPGYVLGTIITSIRVLAPLGGQAGFAAGGARLASTAAAAAGAAASGAGARAGAAAAMHQGCFGARPLMRWAPAAACDAAPPLPRAVCGATRARALLAPWGPAAARGMAVAARAKRGSRGGAAAAGPPAAPPTERIEERELHAEASEAYLSYAMSVIVGRALPDVRDGLKPVHRRILYAMHDLGITPGRPYKKCARVVGEVLGKYHPHGDAAVYDALVRLAQDFSMSLPLISGHGNFGSLDDDPPAAMRYTECRLAAAAPPLLLDDLDADTVDWAPTFDNSQTEPTVLPAKLPLLLVNGTQGIAVGIATKIPPHNLGEVVDALVALVKDPDISVAALMQHIPGPDFPTGGELVVGPGVKEAYETGNGSVLLRARIGIEGDAAPRGGTAKGRRGRKGSAAAAAAEEEEEAAAAAAAGGGGGNGRQLIVVTEMPYQVNKAELTVKIAELVEAKTIEGVADVRDESDRTGVRLVVEVKRGYEARVVLNQLLKHTRLQMRFSCNMVALVGGVPQTLTLKDFLQHFLNFRVEVVERRARHALGKARARLHLVEGFLAALKDLEAVVKAIRAAPDGAAAKAALCGPGFGLSEAQAEGVLGLTLRRLTGLEAGRLAEEKGQLIATVKQLEGLLGDRAQVLEEVVREAREVAAKHGAPRRTRIMAPEGDGEGGGTAAGELREEDLVPDTPCLVTLSSRGYIKRQSPEVFEAQRRGGKGKSGGRLRDNDALEEAVTCTTHDSLLLLAASGKAFAVRAWRVPEASRTSAGTAVAQVLGLSSAERFTAMLPAPSSWDASAHLVMATANGAVKRTALDAFSGLKAAKRSSGILAIKLQPGDALVAAGLCQDGGMVLLSSSGGRVANFEVGGGSFRSKGRASAANKGIRLRPGEQVVSMSVLTPAQAAVVKAQAAALADDGDDDEGGEGGEDGGGGGGGAEPEAAGPWMVVVTSQGIGKRVALARLPLRVRRGSAGNIAVKLDAGDAVAMAGVVASEDDEVVIASRQGQIARFRASDVRCPKGRASRGSRLLALNAGDEVQTCAVVPPVAAGAV
ncbi:MAG: DNA gyrase, A subunit [Monoraphidium minutum]|nr:MAG: DNA gyrase, A subunit [Monoraphidium minutum]